MFTKHTPKIFLTLAVVLLLAALGVKITFFNHASPPAVETALAQTLDSDITYQNMIEDFEQDPVWLDQPGTDGWFWQSGGGAGAYTWALDPTQGANGTNRSLKFTVTEGAPYFWYLTADQNAYINRNAEFPVNHMRFYIKFPKGWFKTNPLPTAYNFHIGTYHRDPDILGNHETNNWHFYQELVFDAYDDEWIKVDINQWAQHQRSLKMLPGVSPTKPEAHFYQNLSRIYFTGVPYHTDTLVGYPHNIWFDEFEFYYQNEYVATQPEYYEKSILPESAIYYPITITNTHLTENRRFSLACANEQIAGGSYWDYDVKIIKDDNGDGIHQDTENTIVNETTLLGPNEKFYVFIRVATPGIGKYTPDTSYWQTSFVVYQKEPVWQGDPHLVATSPWYGVQPGTPAAGTQIITRAVSALPPADTTPPSPAQDLIIQQVYDHSVKLAWTAPGDDGAIGTAYAYDVRYSKSPITDANFENALPFTDELAPKNSGAQEVYVVPPLLEPQTFYYFALKAYDETYQTTTISNVVSATTLKAAETKDIKVYAGSGQTITMPAIVQLSGNVKRDGVLDPSIPTTWSKLSGPGTVTFSNPSTWDTTATFSQAGQYTLQLTADDQGYVVSSSVLIVVRPQGDSSAILLVDFGQSAAEDKFGLSGWGPAMLDTYTSYTMAGSGGTVGGTNGDYNFQGVQGTPYGFAIGDKIVITWYNNSANPVTFNPYISFGDPDRRTSGQTGTWYSIGSNTIPSYAIATTEFTFNDATAGDYSLVNVNNNFADGKQILVCDKIELVKFTSPTPNITLTKSAAITGQPPTQAQTGDIITYTIIYTNNGTGDAQNVRITDPIPTGTSYVQDSADSTGGAFNGTQVSWDIGAVVAGASGSVSFQVGVE